MTEPHDYLPEDLGDGDVTTQALVPERVEATARITAGENCVLAGLKEAVQIFKAEGLDAAPMAGDGERVEACQTVLELRGDARAALRTERLALNFLMRMSGIATATRSLVDRCRLLNPDIRIAATRKTTPGFRRYEKRAVVLGGGHRHREGLYDQFLIKDNHLKLVGSITRAVEAARAFRPDLKVEVEVVDVPGAEEAASAGADVIMLDNMPPELAREAAGRIRAIDPNIDIEVSGGINPDNITEYAEFADVISLGWLTHSARAVDFSLEFV